MLVKLSDFLGQGESRPLRHHDIDDGKIIFFCFKISNASFPLIHRVVMVTFGFQVSFQNRRQGFCHLLPVILFNSLPFHIFLL